MEEDGDIEETQQQQEPLFKFLSDSCCEEGAKEPNPKYEDGKILPKKLRTRFLEEAKPCVPLEEIDLYFRNKQTFIVIGRWGTLHRFSCSPNGHFILGPNNPFRRLAIYLITNWIFSTFIVATLLLNIVALAKTQNYEIMSTLNNSWSKRSWIIDAFYVVDYVCLAIYIGELILKIVARGFVGDQFTSFRDPWTYLDVIIIWAGFTSYSFILDRRSAKWLRLFKLIPLIPSIRQAGKLSIKAVKRLGGMLILAVTLVWFFSLLGSQIYMGTLTQKCVKQMPDGVSNEMWTQHANNMSNWYVNDGMVVICGNSTGSGVCPDNYVCLQGFGMSPDGGYTKFDSVLWSLLSVLRISLDDYTEEIFQQVLAANGPWHIIFFELLFLLITYPIGCIFFGILANLFKESKVPSEVEMEEELTGLTEVHDFDAPEELVGLRKTLHSFMFHDWLRRIVIVIILIDVYSIAQYYDGVGETVFDYRVFIRIIPLTVFLLYTLEFLLKIIALGPASYFRDRWNIVDSIVLLTFFLEIHSYFGFFTGYYLAPIRMIKLVRYWPRLRMIFSVYYKTIKALWGWILYAAIVCAFFVFIGPFEIGKYESHVYNLGGPNSTITSKDLPRWTFVDFWHSFRMIVRAQIGEWVETFWDVFRYTSNTVWFYLAINSIGALLLSFLLIGIVHTSLNELQSGYNPSKERGLRFLFRKAIGLMPLVGNGGDGERRKKSAIAESRTFMQDCAEHWAYKIATSVVIVIASLAMIYETKDASEDLQKALFVIEIIFTVVFCVIAIYELVSYGFKESILNRGWVFDAIIVLENILNLTLYQFSVTGPFLKGIFCIRAFRPLMLIARLDWLKAPFCGLKKEVKTLWETVLAVFFIWLFFDTLAVHSLAGLYYRCIDESSEEQPLTKDECLRRNMTWENSDFHFDNSGNGFINMLFLVSRMGWVSIINDGSDAVDQASPRQKDASKFWLIYFIFIVLTGGLGAMGIVFSYVFKRFKDDKGYNIILTESQVEVYEEAKKRKDPKESGITLEDEYIPPPKSQCPLSLYNFITNQKFDAVVMTLIILDNIILSFDYYQMPETRYIILMLLRLLILVFYLGEMIVKLVAWRRHYFRNGWNYLDMLVTLTGIFELFLEISSSHFIISAVIRMLRLTRIFRFFLAKNCGLTCAKILFNSVTNTRHALGNLILLQLTIMWAYAMLGHYLWANLAHSGGMMTDQINYTTFRQAFWTLALLRGFPGLDTKYSALSNETDCEVKDPEFHTCGDRNAAIFFIGSYVALTFLVLLNMYAVLITEIISEIERFNSDAKSDADGDVPLEDVTTDNRTKGEFADMSENVEVNFKDRE